MGISIIPSLLAVFTLLTYSPSDNEPWHTRVGQQVPDFEFQLKDSPPLSIEAYRGKVVLLNFFATWCPHCRRELPYVQEDLWNVHGENPNFEILVLAREENWDKLDPFIEENGYTFPIVPDLERKIFSKFALQTIPRNVVLDREGKIIYQSIGFSADEFGKMVELIERELAAD